MSPQGWLCSSRRAHVLVLCGVLWLVGPTWADAVPQGEWVTTGPPIGILATGGSLIVLEDGTPLSIIHDDFIPSPEFQSRIAQVCGP